MVILRATDNFGNKADLDILEEGGLFCDISAIESTDIGSVFGVSSQEFMLPGTDNNNQFFGNMFDIGADPSVALNHTIYASVLIDGQEGFDGRMYINDILKDDKGYVMYKAVVVNQFVDFKQRIRDLRLSNLDFSAYEHDLTLTNVTDSWDGNLAGGNIVYPLVDYGTSDPVTTISNGVVGEFTFNNEDTALPLANWKPGIRARAIIDAVFDQTNYNYSSSFIDSDYFSDIFVLSTPETSKGVPGSNPTIHKSKADFQGEASQSISAASTAQVIFPNEVYDVGSEYDETTGNYTIAVAGDYDFGTQVDLTWASAPSSGDFNRAKIRIRKNGVNQATNTVVSNTTTGFGGVFHKLFGLVPGDVISVSVQNDRVQGAFNGPTIPGADLLVGGSRTKFTGNSLSQLVGGPVDMARMFPTDVTVEDFLKGMIEKFNLVIEPKAEDPNTLIIEPFNTWRDSGVVKDWSDKVDHSVRKSIRGTMIDNPHVLTFKDAEDTDYLNQVTQDSYSKVFGEKLYTSNSDLTSGVREIGNFFAPTPVMAVDGTSFDIIPHLYEVDNDKKKPMKFKMRLLHFCGKKEVTDINAYNSSGNFVNKGYWAKDETGTPVQINYYGQFHYLYLNGPSVEADLKTTRDLNWNNIDNYHFVPEVLQGGYYAERDAIYEYWAQYLNELYDAESKRLTLNLIFSPEEIKNIQLNDKIFIDGHYYRIDKITNFDLINHSSVQVALIKAPVRKFNYPVRRIYDIEGPNNGNGTSGTYTDLTVDPSSGLGIDGTVTFVNVDDGLPPTGSGNQGLVGRVAALDGFSYFPNDLGSGVWNTGEIQPTIGFRRQVSLGDNQIDYSANNITAVGNNNTVEQNVTIATIQGSGNNIQAFTEYVNVSGDNNTVEEQTKKSSIISSTNSSLKNNTELGVIIGGEDTIISGSNKSVAIGQDTITQGGNSNIVIGNFDTQTRTVTDMINTVVINPNRDIESRENSGSEDFSGRAYLGSYQEIGSHYSDNKTITLSAGDTLYLTGSAYTNDSVYDVTWSGGNGSANVYLPEVDPNIASLDKGQGGYKRLLRFIGDGTLDSEKQVVVNAFAGDSINGAFNGFYTIDSPYETLELYGVKADHWRILEAGTPSDSGGGHEGAYGSFYSTADQPIVTPATAQKVTMNATFASNAISNSSGTIIMDYNGAYSFTYTAKVQNADNVIHYADFWIKYNGTDYPNSTVRVAIPSRKNSSEFTLTPVTIQLLDVAVNNGDQIELYWRGDSTLLSLNYEDFGGTIPNAPSMRATIHAV